MLVNSLKSKIALFSSLSILLIFGFGSQNFESHTQVNEVEASFLTEFESAFLLLASATSVVTTSDGVITDADVGSTFDIFAFFDEIMNTAIEPVVEFQNGIIIFILDNTTWTSNQEFQATFSVDSDTQSKIDDIDVFVSGAVVLGTGSSAGTATGTDLIDLDLENPTVATTFPDDDSDGIISLSDVTFNVVSTFSETMNTGATPIVSFSPDVTVSPLALSLTGGSWSQTMGNPMDTYTSSYDVFDIGVEVLLVTASTSGAQDAVGNPQQSDPTSNTFNIDHENPTVLSITPQLTPITDAHNGGTFTITVLYSENMDTGTNPTITFPVEDPTNTITSPSGNWPSATTYVATYTVANAGEKVDDVDIKADGAKDAAGNSQVAKTETNEFSIDNENPTVATSTSDDKINGCRRFR